VYCGGSFTGITNHLDYIQGMGFDAVWISPITVNLPQDTADGEAYHGYWQQDLYGINSNFGTASELQDLASALHSRSMVSCTDTELIAQRLEHGREADDKNDST
jgi:alpha-amylase